MGDHFNIDDGYLGKLLFVLSIFFSDETKNAGNKFTSLLLISIEQKMSS